MLAGFTSNVDMDKSKDQVSSENIKEVNETRDDQLNESKYTMKQLSRLHKSFFEEDHIKE